MSGGSRRARGRRAVRGKLDEAQVGGHSVIEVGSYAMLAAVVAAVVLVAGGHPWWHAVAVLAGVAALIGVLAFVAARDQGEEPARRGRRSRQESAGRRRRS